MRLAKSVRRVKLLLLSSFPSFRRLHDVVQLLNVLNVNDGRYAVHPGAIFEKDGVFAAGGAALLRQKALGYVSFVEGEANAACARPLRVFVTGDNDEKEEEGAGAEKECEVQSRLYVSSEADWMDRISTREGDHVVVFGSPEALARVPDHVTKLSDIPLTPLTNVRQLFVLRAHGMASLYDLERLTHAVCAPHGHRDLSPSQRNTEIYLCAWDSNDVRAYCRAETRARRIGQAIRVLKQSAVDCVMHVPLRLCRRNEDELEQRLCSGQTVHVSAEFAAESDGSAACDFTTCQYECASSTPPSFSSTDEALRAALAAQFREHYVTTRPQLMQDANYTRHVPLDQDTVYEAIRRMADERAPLVDKYDQPGCMVCVGELVAFQPT
jgi:hypothetical protein